MRHDSAWKVAESLVEHLRPTCTRIEIKGSLIRCKPEVKDIDILAVPDFTPVPRDRPEFGKPVPPLYKLQLDKMLAEMEADGAIRITKNGDHSKVFYLKYAGIACEVYLVIPPATWGVRSVIRTGPADFSHWMVSRRVIGGALPNDYFVNEGQVWDGRTGKPFDTPEEIDWFRLCGLDWIEPKDRVARWKK